MACLSQLDVVILAGGLGTRIRPIYPGRPKAMIPINGRPFLSYLFDQVESFGARRVILALGHMASIIEKYARERCTEDLEIVTSIEPAPQGTGGGLRTTMPHISSDVVLVMNGDSFTRIDLCRFVEFHRMRPASLSMVLTYVPDSERFGIVETGEDGVVKSFTEKPPQISPGGYINAGIYLVEKNVIAQTPPAMRVSLERDIFPSFIGRGFYAYKGDFPFIDIGTPESYRVAGSFFSEEAYAN